jgi:hypothetical protein
VIQAKAGSARAVEHGQTTPERLVVVGPAPPGLDVFEHQEVRILGQDRGHAQGTRIGQPGETTGLGREHSIRSIAVALDEDDAPIRQARLVRRIDVASGHRIPTHDRASERRLEFGEMRVSGHDSSW